MNDVLDFSIERFAELSALCKARGEEALPTDVRDRWGDIARALNERIAADLGAGSGRLAITFASVYRPALAALRASPATPSAPREEPAATVDPATPTFLLSSRSDAVIEVPSRSGEPEGSLDTTREIDEGKVGLPAVPFRAGVPAASPVADDSDFDARRPPRNTGTVDLDQSALRDVIFHFRQSLGSLHSRRRPQQVQKGGSRSRRLHRSGRSSRVPGLRSRRSWPAMALRTASSKRSPRTGRKRWQPTCGSERVSTRS